MILLTEMEKDWKELEEKTEELIKEFNTHYQKYTELHPEAQALRNEIFQAWVFQKLAGIHVSILKLVSKKGEI